METFLTAEVPNAKEENKEERRKNKTKSKIRVVSENKKEILNQKEIQIILLKHNKEKNINLVT